MSYFRFASSETLLVVLLLDVTMGVRVYLRSENTNIYYVPIPHIKSSSQANIIFTKLPRPALRSFTINKSLGNAIIMRSIKWTSTVNQSLIVYIAEDLSSFENNSPLLTCFIPSLLLI